MKQDGETKACKCFISLQNTIITVSEDTFTRVKCPISQPTENHKTVNSAPFDTRNISELQWKWGGNSAGIPVDTILITRLVAHCGSAVFTILTDVMKAHANTQKQYQNEEYGKHVSNQNMP